MAFQLAVFDGTFWQNTQGDIYVSPLGNDDTGDGSPTSPYGTIQKGLDVATGAELIVVGSGVYVESLDALGKSISIAGDGTVTLDGEGTLLDGIVNLDAANSEISRITIKGFTNSAVSTAAKSISGCRLDGNIAGFGGEIRFCVISNGTFDALTSTTILRSTLISITQGANTNYVSWKSSIFDAGTSLSASSTTLLAFDYCNQEPSSTITIDSTAYADATSVNSAFASYQTNGQSVNSDFAKTSIGDYSLLGTSALVDAGEFMQPIGAYGTGLQLHDGSTSVSSFSLTGVGLGPTDPEAFELLANTEIGIIETAVIDLGSPKKIGRMNLFAEHLFGSTPSGINHVSAVAGISPRLVSYEMRFGESVVDIQSNDYKSFIWNHIPRIDNNGYGNAEVDFDRSTARTIASRYVQIRIRLNTNNFSLLQEDLDCLLQEDLCKILWKVD